MSAMLAITGAALLPVTGAVLVVVGLGLVLVPWSIKRYDAWRDPDGARALARRDRGKLARDAQRTEKKTAGEGSRSLPGGEADNSPRMWRKGHVQNLTTR